ncbi:MAG: hypothetical protein HY644_00200 [Acidobacteria bacterium]|nr:hypothetical protein [Acidobacteriota bacterium]
MPKIGDLVLEVAGGPKECTVCGKLTHMVCEGCQDSHPLVRWIMMNFSPTNSDAKDKDWPPRNDELRTSVGQLIQAVIALTQVSQEQRKKLDKISRMIVGATTVIIVLLIAATFYLSKLCDVL